MGGPVLNSRLVGDIFVDFGLLVLFVRLSERRLSLERARLGSRDAQVDERWHTESEALGHLLEIERVDIVHGLHAVTCVGSHVRLVALLGAQVQEVVLLDQFLQLEI